MNSKWARPIGQPKWCLVAAVTSRVATACAGSWSTTEPYETCDIPPTHERCGGCERAVELDVTVVVDVEESSR